MTTYNDDNMNLDDSNPPEESNNRTFLIAAGGLGLLVLIALLCLGAYVLFNFNSGRTQEATAAAQATNQQATLNAGSTQFAEDQALTQTAAVTLTILPSSTPVIAQPSSTTSPTPDPATATVAAAFTQIAGSTQTIIPTSTALPNTGFADDVGVPGLLVMAIALVVVIFLVRRLRAVPTR